MSFNTDTGHLFDDSHFCGAYTKIDAQEQLRTKEKNCREDRALRYKAKVIDRAREVSSKSLEHEQRLLRLSLVDIKAKSMAFRNVDRKFGRNGNAVNETNIWSQRERMRKGRYVIDSTSESTSQTISNASSSTQTLTTEGADSQRTLVTRRRYSRSLPPIEIITDRGKTYEIHPKPHVRRIKGELTKGNAATDPAAATDTLETNLKHDTKKVIKRVKHVSKSLDKLYKKRMNYGQSLKVKDKSPKPYISPFGASGYIYSETNKLLQVDSTSRDIMALT